MSVREPGVAAPDLDEKVYHALLANAADFMVDRYDADIVFVPMERSVLDTQHSHAVIAKMLRAQRLSVLKESTPRPDRFLDGQVRLRARHAAAFHLRRDPGHAVRGASVRRQGERVSGCARPAYAAASACERRAPHRLSRRFLGPPPFDARASPRRCLRCRSVRAKRIASCSRR